MIQLINIAKKVCFSRKLEKKTILDFFSICSLEKVLIRVIKR